MQQPKITAVQQQQQLDALQEQFVTMAHMGIELIESYGAGPLEKDESKTLAAMGAALFASYFSSSSSLAAKKTAIGIVLRAAFCYGQEQGRNAASEPGENDGDGAGGAGAG